MQQQEGGSTVRFPRSDRFGCCLLLSTFLLGALCAGCGPASREQHGQSASEATPRVAFATKVECADRAAAYLRHEREIDSPQNGINAFIRSEQFTFNRSLNTCLVYFEVVEAGAGISYTIVDTLTNRRLYYHVSSRDRDTQRMFDETCKTDKTCLSESDLQNKRVELFERSE